MFDNEEFSKQNFVQKKLGTRHLQIFLILLGVSITCAGRFGMSVAIVGMTDPNSRDTGYPVTYNWDSEGKAIILSSFSWSYVIMQIPSGIFADVYSAHKLLCYGVFLSNLVNVLAPLSVYNFGWTSVVVCRMLMGFTQSCLIPCFHAFISRWVPSAERSRLVFEKMSGNDDSSRHHVLQNKLGTRHLQVFLMFLGVSLSFAGRYAISVAVVAMTDSNSTIKQPIYDWNSEEKAVVLSSFFWGYMVMQIPCGIVADIHSAHILVCCVVFISSLVNVLTPLCIYYFGWTGAVVCRILMGLTQSGLVPCSHTIYAKWIPYEQRSRIGSFAMVGPYFGIFAGLVVSGWLVSSAFPWPSIFYVFGTIGMLWAILFYYIATDSPSKHKGISPEERDYIETSLNKSTDSKVKPTNIPWKSLLTSLPVWSLAVINCGHAWGLLIYLNKLPAYIKYGLGYDIGQSGIVSALPNLTTLLMSFFFGWICNWALKSGASLRIVRKVSTTIAIWGAGVGLLALCLIPTSSSVIPLTILIIIFGLDAANFFGFHINHIDIAPNYAGAQVAMFNAAASAFGQTALLICGYIVTDETNLHQWHLVFYITAGMYFVTNLIYITFGQAQVQSWN